MAAVTCCDCGCTLSENGRSWGPRLGYAVTVRRHEPVPTVIPTVAALEPRARPRCRPCALRLAEQRRVQLLGFGPPVAPRRIAP